MPRRWCVDGKICHVFNRAAAKLPVFKTSQDYRAFLEILGRTKGQAQPAIRLYGYCVMPTHWHLIICAGTTPALSQFMRHLTRRHAVAYLANHPERSGAVYQGRFKCVPVQDGDRLPPCEDWLAQVNRTESADDLAEAALKRNLPIGDPEWVATLSREWNELRRPPGRPGKLNREELSVTNAGGPLLDLAD